MLWYISTDLNLFFPLHQEAPTEKDIKGSSRQIPHNLKQAEVLAGSIGKPHI